MVIMMADSLSPEKRSWNMSRIKGKDTSIEVQVRKYLFGHGFRYRKNVSTLPGKPDIVLKKHRAVIFVNGCFWHRHTGCKEAYMPKSRVEFWRQKFERNVQNDALYREKLINTGWRVFVVWECEVKRHYEETMNRLVEEIRSIELR
jgi:DNA mismatch endonuclease (patch repair protein)